MELKAYAKILMRRWWLVLVPVAMVLVYLAATYAPPATMYQVVVRFSTGTTPAGLSLDYDRYHPWLVSEYIAKGLADVTETGVFAEAVAARLREVGLDTSAGAVERAIVTDNARSIVVVYLTWPDPGEAALVAEALADELVENSGAYYPQIGDLGPAVRLLDSPEPMALPPSVRAQLAEPAVRIGLALFTGVGLAFLWHYLDPTVQEAEELEELGWEVVARIPRK